MKEAQVIEAKKSLAKFEIRSAEQARSRLQEQNNATTRWLVASLFTINAGPILAIFSSDNFEYINLRIPISIYFLGILCSFGMGVFLQISDRMMITAMHSWGQYWTTFVDISQSDETEEARIKGEIDNAETVGRRGRKFGLNSMFCFTVASLFVIGYLFGAASVLNP